MRDAVIVEAVRTAIAKRGGALAGVHPAPLSSAVLRALTARSGISPTLIDDVVWGCVTQVGEQSLNIGRTAVLGAGWPESVPAVTIDRQCGSSQQAVQFAASGVISGQYEFVVAGGVESMTRVPMLSSRQGEDPYGPEFSARYGGTIPHQGAGAELIAERWSLNRSQLDEFSLESHAKAAAAQDAGLFERETIGLTLADGAVFGRDEGVRRGSTLESLGGIRSAFTPNGLVTAGNSSQLSDAAAALLITTTENAERHGLTPLARIRNSVAVGSDPIMMLTGPIAATQRVLERAGLAISDIGVFEINEAFASVPLAWGIETGADLGLLNPRGGAVALGHPLGASGARLMTTMLNHMRDNGIRYGLQSMCEGGGQANATILELLSPT